jgi:hypothetical protein
MFQNISKTPSDLILSKLCQRFVKTKNNGFSFKNKGFIDLSKCHSVKKKREKKVIFFLKNI